MPTPDQHSERDEARDEPRRLDPRTAALLAAGATSGTTAGIGLLAALLWVVAALGLHGGVALVADRFSGGARQDAPPDEKTELEYVEVKLELPEEEEVVEPEPEPEPEPVVEEEEVVEPEPEEVDEPEEVAEAEPEPEEIVEPEPQRDPPPPERAPSREAPPEAEVANDDFSEFDDFGALDTSMADQGIVEVIGGSSASGKIDSDASGSRKQTRRKPRRDAAGSPDGAPDGVQGGTGDPDKPVARSKLDRQAEPDEDHNRRLKAPYPPELQQAGIEADVVAIVTVRADGRVSKVRIVNAAKLDKAFVEAAKKVFQKFRFEPAIMDGTPVASEIRLVYRFRLDDT